MSNKDKWIGYDPEIDDLDCTLGVPDLEENDLEDDDVLEEYHGQLKNKPTEVKKTKFKAHKSTPKKKFSNRTTYKSDD